MWELTNEQVESDLAEILNNKRAELEAIESISINTKYKTLTNRAIVGKDCKIRNSPTSVNGSKELVYYYTILNDGRRNGAWSTIVASENLPDSIGGVYPSRINTPQELSDKVADRVANLKEQITNVESELLRVPEIVSRHNELTKLVDKFNNTIRYATKARV